MGNDILRIETDDNYSKTADQPTVLRLSGHLIEKTLPSLEPLVENACAAGLEIELDLQGVISADQAASNYLARLSKMGVRLLQCPLAIRVWLREIDPAETNGGMKP